MVKTPSTSPRLLPTQTMRRTASDIQLQQPLSPAKSSSSHVSDTDKGADPPPASPPPASPSAQAAWDAAQMSSAPEHTPHLADTAGQSNVAGQTTDLISNDDIETVLIRLRAANENGRVNLLCTKDAQGQTALHVAGYNGKIDALKEMLLSIPKDKLFEVLSGENDVKDTVLHAICDGPPGAAEIIKILDHLPGDQRADLMSIQNFQGDTALHIAAYAENASAVKLFLDHLPGDQRADFLNIKNNHETTALHITSSQKDPSTHQSMLGSISKDQHSNLSRQPSSS